MSAFAIAAVLVSSLSGAAPNLEQKSVAIGRLAAAYSYCGIPARDRLRAEFAGIRREYGDEDIIAVMRTVSTAHRLALAELRRRGTVPNFCEHLPDAP